MAPKSKTIDRDQPSLFQAVVPPRDVSVLSFEQRGTLIAKLLRSSAKGLTEKYWDEIIPPAPQPTKINPHHLPARIKKYYKEAVNVISLAVKEADEMKENAMKEAGAEPGSAKRRRLERDYEGSAPNSADNLLPLLPLVRALATDFPPPLTGPKDAFSLLLEILELLFANPDQPPAFCERFPGKFDDALLAVTEERWEAEGSKWNLTGALQRLRAENLKFAREEWGCGMEKTVERLRKLQAENPIEL